MNAHTLRIIGIAFNAFGALILAVRVKKILDAMAFAVECHETNIQQLMKEITGRNRDDIVNLANSPQHVEEAQKIGTKLLVIAFLMIFVGNVLQGISMLSEVK